MANKIYHYAKLCLFRKPCLCRFETLFVILWNENKSEAIPRILNKSQNILKLIMNNSQYSQE